MQQREKILAAVLLGTLGIGWGAPKAWDAIQGPVTERRAREKLLDKQLDTKQQELTVALARLRNMKDWKARSLPPDPQVAALAYQQWLTDLAEIVVRFADLKVSAPTRLTSNKNKTYAAVRLTITGQATLMQVREFLYRFARADVLHHVTDMKLDSQQNEGNPLLRVSVSVEGLALKEAPRTRRHLVRTDGTERGLAGRRNIPDRASSRRVPRLVPLPRPDRCRVRDGDGSQRHSLDGRTSRRFQPKLRHSNGTVVESAPSIPP